jgi:hypothetical protein
MGAVGRHLGRRVGPTRRPAWSGRPTPAEVAGPAPRAPALGPERACRGGSAAALGAPAGRVWSARLLRERSARARGARSAGPPPGSLPPPGHRAARRRRPRTKETGPRGAWPCRAPAPDRWPPAGRAGPRWPAAARPYSTPASLSPRNGGFPVRHRKATQASAYWSVRPSSDSPLICSGDAYSSVPTNIPVRVSEDAESVRLVSPKSVRNTRSGWSGPRAGSIRMLAGFTSRWTRFRRWAASCTGITAGWSSEAARRASRRKRSRKPGSAASSGATTLRPRSDPA